MPQASPMNWMIMSISLSSIISTSMSIKNKNNSTSKKTFKPNLKSKNMTWKW